MALITTEDKVRLQDKPLIAERNKFTAENYNELKAAINNNHERVVSIEGQGIRVTTEDDLTINSGGIFIYKGTTSANWTLPELQGVGGVPMQIKIKNRSPNGSDLTLSASGSDKIFDSKERSAVIISSGDEMKNIISEEYWTI